MDNCKIGKAPNGKINKVLDISGNESTLFKEILNIPTLTVDEAIDVYKNIYGDKLKDKVKFQKQENDYNKERTDGFQKNESTRDEQTRDRTRWDSRRGNQTLTGAPTYKNATGATPELVALAEEYAEENGIDYVRQSMYVDIDEDRAYRIGTAYAEMKHEPENPIVKEAYQNLINQTLAQYKKLVEAGYQFYFFDDKNDPYDGKPARAMVELRGKKTMAVYATDSGFGSGATDINVDDNPMLQDTGFEWGYGSIDGKKIKVLANDLFRCFTPETLVRTSEGFKEIKDIKIGDLVLTHEGRFKKVYDTIKNPHKGKILNISTNASYNPIKVTPEHPFYVLKGNHGEQKNSICTPHICDRKQPNGNITAQEKYHSFDWVEAKDLKEKMWFPLTVDTTVTDLDFIEIPNKHYTGKTNIPQKIELTDDFLSFVGLYIAEGSGGTNRININLHKDEQYLIDLTDRFAKSIGYKMKSRIIGNGIALQINCKILKDWFSEWLGRGSFNKKIPNEFLQLPPEKLKHIAYGIFSGDGKKTHNCIEQTSLVLALQLVEVGSRLGMQPTTNRINYSKNVNHSDTYTTHEFSKSEHNFKQKKYTWKILNKDCRNITKIEEEYYEGFVYNIEVEDDHSYVVENVPVHNCVHDSFGHGLEGAGFRAKGEENAWQAHARLFTGSAIAAITSETRGQNSWLNYNKTLYKDVVGEKKAKEMYPGIWDIINVGEHNRTAKVEDTIFADQKVGLMPEWTWEEGFDEGVKLTYNEQGQHLAPNGKPSNLTVSQAIQVRTQNFKNWFGNWENDPQNASKVVDENGEPKIVKHGTPKKDFFEFDKNAKKSTDFGWLGTGFYFFGNNDEYASQYSLGGRVMEVFLNIREPYYASYEDMNNLAEEDNENASKEFRRLIEKEYEADGILYDEDLNEEWVAYYPNQIKSATENTGEFSNDSNDIRYQIIGEKGASRNINYNQKLNEAKDLEKQGKSIDEISQATGWYKSNDGWKYLSKEIVEEFKIINSEPNKELTLTQVLGNENKIFQLYPEMQEIKVVFYDKTAPNYAKLQPLSEDSYGDFIADTQTIRISTMDEKGRRTLQKMQNTLGHEVSHYGAKLEGFSKGGNLQTILDETVRLLNIKEGGKRLSEITQEIENADKSKLTKEQFKVVDKSLETISALMRGDKSTLYNQYKHILGEIDANIVGELTEKNKVVGTYGDLLSLYINNQNIDPNSIFLIGGGKVEFQIIGEKGAKNLDQIEEATHRLDNLLIAQQMQKANKTALEIRLATGWEMSLVDQKWRYEILDGEFKNLTYKKEYDVTNFENLSGMIKLSDFYNNAELFNAYPELKDTQVIIYNTENEFDKPHMFIYNKAIFINEKKSINNTKGLRSLSSFARGGLLHELSHTVQNIEGFGRGDSPASMEQRIRDAINDFQSGNTQIDKNSVLSFLQRQGLDLTGNIDIEKVAKENAFLLYENVSGEVEARSVQKRMSMTAEQRKNKLFAETEKISTEDQIYLRNALGINSLEKTAPQITQELIDRLALKGLAKKVTQLTTKELDAKLKELGVSDDVRKQIIAYNKGYYSNAQEALTNLKDKNPKNVKGWISQLTDTQKNGGIKNVNQELEWIGLEDYLNEYVKENNPKAGNIPSSAVEDYIKSNQIEIVDVSKEDKKLYDEPVLNNNNWVKKEPSVNKYVFQNDNYKIDPEGRNGSELTWFDRNTSKREILGTFEDIDKAVKYATDHNKSIINAKKGDTKYSGYQLKGAENYREVLLTMPNSKKSNELPIAIPVSETSSKFYLEFSNGDRLLGTYSQEEVNKILEEKRKGLSPSSTEQYKSSHWDEANILAHVRLNDKTLPDGRKVLIVNEIQSDASEDIKKEEDSILSNFIFKDKDGKEYKKPSERDINEKQLKLGISNLKNFNYLLSSLQDSGIINMKDESADIIYEEKEYTHEEFVEFLSKRENISYEIRKAVNKNTVPNFTAYKQTDRWVGLVTRRVMQMAAQEGYDGIAIATGQQSADMYSLAKSIEKVNWENQYSTGDAFVSITLKGNTSVDNKFLVNRETGIISNTLIGANYDGKKFDDLVGKDLANKVVSEKFGVLEGEGLEFGGEGMKTFYDKIVTKVVQKEAQRFDKNAKLESIDFTKQPLKVELAFEGYEEEGKRILVDSFGNIVDAQYGSRFPNDQDYIEAFQDAYNNSQGVTINKDKLSLAKQPYIAITDKMKSEFSNKGIPQFQKQLSDKGITLTVNGVTFNNEIFLNSDTADDSTLIHEYSHLLNSWLKENRKETYNKGISLIEDELAKESKGISEIQDVIDYVKRTQPTLTGERFKEELLTEFVGRYSKQMMDEQKQKSPLMQWLSDFWESIKEILNLSDYTPEQVANMTLADFAKSSVSELLSGENIGIKAQQYFTRNADRLPLTLAIFNRPEFKDLQGRQVNPQTIKNYLNQTGLKQIEKDLINQAIEDNYKGQKKISYDELEATVRANIMPLERITTTSHSDYGMKKLANGNYGKHKTLILNAPIEHGVIGHFPGDFKASGRQNIKYIAKPLDANTWVAVEEGYESQANPNNIYQYVGTSGTKEAVDAWIVQNKNNDKDFDVYKFKRDEYGRVTEKNIVNSFYYQSDAEKFISEQDKYDDYGIEKNVKTDNINKGMFGHIRVWQDGQDYYVAELQSDTYQKNKAKDLFIKQSEISKKAKENVVDNYKNLIKLSNFKKNEDNELSYNLNEVDITLLTTDYGVLVFIEGLNDFTADDYYTTTEDALDYVKSKVGNFVFTDNKIFENDVKKEKTKVEQEVINKLSPQEKQFIASQKIWEQRMVREAIKEASLSGATSLRFPTPYTLSVIEGYVSSEEVIIPYNIVTLYEGEEYISSPKETDIVKKGDKIFISDSKYIVINSTDSQFIVANLEDDITDNLIQDIRDNRNNQKYNPTQEEIKEHVGKDLGSGVELIEGKFIDTSAQETFGQPNTYKTVSKENFDIATTLDRDKNGEEHTKYNEKTGKEEIVRTQRTVAYKYEEIAEILKKEKSVEVVTDENGFDWYEAKIEPQDTQKPVVAFQIIGKQGVKNTQDAISRLDNLKVAQEMEKGNKTPKEIRLATGWEKGIDQKWRYEILDGTLNGVKLNYDTKNEMFENLTANIKLSELYTNQELFEAYPNIKNTEVIFYDTANKMYDENLLFVSEQKIYVNKKYYDRWKLGRMPEGLQNRRTTLEQGIAHELAHILQRIEGFAIGSTRQFNKERIKESISFFRRRSNKNDKRQGVGGRYDAYVERILRNKIPSEQVDNILNTDEIDLELISDVVSQTAYLNFAGEVEARNVESRIGMSAEERLNTLLSETQDILFEDQFILQDKDFTQASSRAIEPILTIETPNGETFTNYQQALQATDVGKIKIKIDDVVLAEVDSDTDIRTFQGTINHLVKQGGLSGERILDLNGDIIFVTQGETETAKHLTSEIVEQQAIKLLGVNNVHNNKNGDFILLDNLNKVVINGETFKKEDIDDTSFEDLSKKFGKDVALEIEFQREYSKALQPTTNRKQLDSTPEFKTEDELVYNIKALLNRLGIKITSIEDYIKNNTIKNNGVAPEATALMDVINKVMAFKNGTISREDLIEETMHLIEATIDPKTAEGIRRNISKTAEWKQYSQEYFRIYSKEYSGDKLDEMVRREILGKVMANAVINNFAQSQDATLTEQSIFAKIKELLEDFFNTINNYFKPEYQKQIDNLNNDIYAKLMAGTLANEMNLDQDFGTKFRLYSTSSNVMQDVVRLQKEAEKSLSILRSTVENIGEEDSSQGQALKGANELLKNVNRAVKNNNDVEGKIEAIATFAKIINIVQKQTLYLQRAEKKAEKNKIPFSAEEMIVYNSLINEFQIGILPQIRTYLKKQDTLLPSEKRLDDELSKATSDIDTLIGDIRNNVFRPNDYVVDLMVKRLSLGKDEEAFLRDKANSQQIETNWFFQNFGTLSHSSNIYISALGSIVTKADNDKRRGFQEDSKPFIQKLFDVGMLSGKSLSKLIDGRYLKSAIDFSSIEKVAQNKKYELFYKSLQKQIDLTTDVDEKASLQAVMDKKVALPKDEEIEELILSGAFDVLDLTHSTTFTREFESWENDEYKLRHFTKDAQKDRAKAMDGYDEYTKNFEKTYSNDYSSIINKAEIDNGVPLITSDMRHDIEKLKKLRVLSKNIRKRNGSLKDGIHVVDSSNPQAKKIDDNLYVVLSPDAKEDAILAVELNQIDFKRREDLKKKAVSPMSPIFKEMLKKLSGTDAYDFLMLNSYVGYTNEYYESMDRPSIIDNLERAKDGENDLEIDDLIEEITTATSQINSILRANKTMNSPTEVSFDNMEKYEETDVKNYSLRLENYYANARAFLSKEDYKAVEDTLSETLPNRAFLKHLIDGGTLDRQVAGLEMFDATIYDDDLKVKADKVINTITEHTTPSKQAEILNLKRDVLYFYSNGVAKFSSVQKRVFSLTEQEYNSIPNDERFAKMTSELLKYSYTKLLPYFKKSMPTGIDRVLYELEAGKLSTTDFLDRYDNNEYEFLSVTPNYNFQEVLDNPNKSKHFANAKKNSTPMYRIFEDSATIDDVRNKSADQLKKEGKLNKYANTKFLNEYGIDLETLFTTGIEKATKNNKEFDARQALIDLQKISLEKQKVLGKHNLYLLPQKERSKTRKFDEFIHSGKDFKEIWNDFSQFREEDAELGQEAGKATTVSHDGNYSIPKFGLRTLTNTRVTDDLLESYMWMNYKANEHKARRINIGDAMTVGQALLGSEFEGNINNKSSRIYNMYKESYDFNFFGVKEAWTKQYDIAGVQFDGAKILKNFGALVRFRNLAFTAISPITSALTGALNIKIETVVGQITDVDAMEKANTYFKDNIGDAAREVMGLQSKAKINTLGEFWGWYEPLERYQNTIYGKAVRGLEKTMFGAHSLANFPVNPRVGLSVLANTKFVDGGILEYRGFAAQNKGKSQKDIRKEWSKLVSVLDVTDTKKDGTIFYDYAKIAQSLNNNFSEDEAKAFMEEKSIVIRGRIKDAIQKVDGQISEEDKSMSTRNAIFSFINTHRSWLMVAAQNRFKKKQINLSTGYMEEGSYTTLANILFDDIIKESRKKGVSAMLKKLRTDYKNYDEVTKKNLKRVLADATVLTALMALTLLAMKKLDDDDEDGWVFQVGSLFLFRTTNEVASSSFALPKNIYDTMGGLVVGLNTLEMATDIPSLFKNEEIERGRYAGLTAMQKYFYKHVPLMKDYNNLFRDVKGGINSYNYFNFTEGKTMQWLPSYFVLEEVIKE